MFIGREPVSAQKEKRKGKSIVEHVRVTGIKRKERNEKMVIKILMTTKWHRIYSLLFDKTSQKSLWTAWGVCTEQ